MRGSRPLTEEEISLLSKNFTGPYRVRDFCLFKLGINTGLRISSLLRLNVSDVWQFDQPVTVLTLKKSQTKTKKTASIPLNTQARLAIATLIQWKRTRGEDLSPDSPLFLSREHGRLTRQQAHNAIKEAVKRCKLTGKVATHSMRKTVGTELMRQGTPLPVIQEVLSHEALETTIQYLGVGHHELVNAVNKLNY